MTLLLAVWGRFRDFFMASSGPLHRLEKNVFLLSSCLFRGLRFGLVLSALVSEKSSLSHTHPDFNGFQ